MAARPATGHSRESLLLQMWKGRTGYLMLVPTMVLLGVFMYYPAFLGLYRSLFDWAPGLDADFVGLGNFVKLFTKDKVFQQSMGNMLQLSLWYVLSTVFVSLFVAILLHRMISQRLKYLYRFLAILPVIIPGIVLLMLWKFIYDATVGPLNMLLIAVGLEEWTRAWLANPNTALYAVMLRNFPWVDGVAILILLAGLQVIPPGNHRERPHRRRHQLAHPALRGVPPDHGPNQAVDGPDHHVGRSGVHGGLRHDPRAVPSTRRWCPACGCSGTPSASTRWAMRRPSA